ncbi:MAG: amidase [Pirellulales bacterium]|nr:amidase [Pirellulales bacterium]
MNAKIYAQAKQSETSTVTWPVSRRYFMATSAAILTGLSSRTLADVDSESEDLIFSSAMSISRAIRAKQVSSEEMVRAFLDRITAVNTKINAVVTLADTQALQEAKKADSELARGLCRGLLHGVPMTIKDSFDTAGVISTAGTMGRRKFIPNHNATAVKRLRAAGAILLGKTNTPELKMSYDTRNLLFGFTKNPYDLTKSPGGSSGGAAAIVAAAGSSFDFGSDTGGSIRVPSGFCGIAGIKPTSGLMPLTGHIIRTGQNLDDSLTQIGPMARFVDDLFPLLRITAGPDGRDPAVIPMPLRDPSDVKFDELRIAFHTDNGIQPATSDVARVVKKAVTTLSDTGCQVEESCPKAISGLLEFWFRLSLVDGGASFQEILKEAGTERWDPHIDWHRQTGPVSGEEVGRLYRKWQQYKAEMTKYMNRFDVIVCPVNAKPSWPSGFELSEQDIRCFTYTAAYNYTGWPAAVVRCGTSDDGMPIGVQVVSKPWREDICLAVAKYLETVLGGWKKPRI